MESNNESRNINNVERTIFAYSIADFIDLSLVEVLTLQFLLRHSEPVIRHSLFLEVNQFLQTEEIKSELLENENLSTSENMYLSFLKAKGKLSTSSFYNNLKNLEKKGLIVSNLNKKGKIESIEPTELTKTTDDVIRKHFLRTGLSLDYEMVFEGASEVLKEIGQEKFKNILLIWPYEYVDFPLLRFLTKIGNSLFILCEKGLYENEIQVKLPAINFTQVYNNMIREPNDIFDFVIFLYVDVKKNILGISRLKLLKESARVTEKNGNVVIVNFSELPLTDNEMTNRLINMYHQANSHQISNTKQLKKEMEQSKFTKIKILKHKGLIFGLGWI